MDLPEKIIWIVCIVSLVCFFGILLPIFGAYAWAVNDASEKEWEQAPHVGDKYETLGVRFDTRPTVCLFEPNPTHVDWKVWKDAEFESWRAILEWQLQMSEFLPEGDWSMYIGSTVPYTEHWNKTPDDYRHCNIFLTFEPWNTDPDSSALGLTGIDFADSRHKFTYIVVYLYAEQHNKIVIDLDNMERDENGVVNFELNFDKKPLPPNAVYNIVLHELGHGLGLGHYTPSGDHKRSAMVQAFDPFDEEELFEIRLADKFMLGLMYGADGYYKPQPPYLYDHCIFIEKGTKVLGCH